MESRRHHNNNNSSNYINKNISISFLGELNKKSKYRKQWKRRYFEIKDGVMKYYTTRNETTQLGNGLRGIFDLTGAKILPISLEDPCRISIITPQDRTTEILLEAESVEEREKVFDALQKGIAIKNTLALANASRLPEIVDWYYQCQAIFNEKFTILEREHRFQLQYQFSSSQNENYSSRSTSSNSTHTTLATPPSTLSSYGSIVLSNSQSPSTTQFSSSTPHSTPLDSHVSSVSIQTFSTTVKIMANKDHTGLFFRVESQQMKVGKKIPMTKLEAMTDGRVLLFRDIENVSEDRPEDFYPSHDQTRDRGISTGSEIGNEIDNRSNSILSSASTINNNNGGNGNGSGQNNGNVSNGIERPIHREEFDIRIVTKEDTLQLRRSNPQHYPSGVELTEFYNWYDALQYAVTFMTIPPPSSTIRNNVNLSHSSSPYQPESPHLSSGRNTSSSAAIHYGFYSMNSGLIFSCAGDVAVILKTFDSLQRRLPSIHRFTTLTTEIFKLIPDVRTNKETISNFGERLEDVIRVLGDQNNGVFWMNNSPSQSGLIDHQISLLSGYLNDFKEYITPLTTVGWMQVIISNQNISKIVKFPRFKTLQSKIALKKRKLKSSSHGPSSSLSLSSSQSQSLSQSSSSSIPTPLSPYPCPYPCPYPSYSNDKCILRQVFETIDENLITICNHLLKNYGDETWVFKKKEYDMAIDLEQTIEVLGGCHLISTEPAKIKALARLIQSDSSDVENEIKQILRHEEEESLNLHLKSRNGSCFQRYFCCCVGRKKNQKEKIQSSTTTLTTTTMTMTMTSNSLTTSLLNESEQNYSDQHGGKSPPSVRWGDEIDLKASSASASSSRREGTSSGVGREEQEGEEDPYKSRDPSTVSTDGVSLRPLQHTRTSTAK